MSQRILILGGGYAGLYAAKSLQNQSDALLEITVVDANPYMTYQPLLPEVAGGHVNPADVTIDLRRTLRHCTVLRGTVTDLDVEQKTANIDLLNDQEISIDYDQVILALGAVTRVFPTPGLKENAVGFKTVEEAVYTHNRVLEQVARAAETTDEAEKRKALTFVFVGGGYTGVEALSELSDLSKNAVRNHPSLEESDLHWVLIEALDRVAPEVGPELSKWTLQALRDRGIDIRLETTIESCENGDVVLKGGEVIPANTIVWTAGVQPNPLFKSTNVPLGPKGHVVANAHLQVVREDGSIVDGAWALGDNAQVPDLTAAKQPAYYPPNAQNAMRQAPVAAKNVVSNILSRPLVEYRHESLGTIASYGIGHGAANVKGIKLKELPAWLMHRAYHGAVIPTFNRKIRVFIGWFTEALTSRETTAMTALETPRKAFTAAFGKSRAKN